jgi:inner membrane protein
MSKLYSDTQLSSRIWLWTSLILSAAITGYAFWKEPFSVLVAFPLSFLASVVGGLPGLTVLLFFVHRINNLETAPNYKVLLLALLNLFICLPYALVAGVIGGAFDGDGYARFFETEGILFACTCIATVINHRKIMHYFSSGKIIPGETSQNFQSQINIHMETTHTVQCAPSKAYANKTFIKGLITGLLIIILLIPTYFISSLVDERKERNESIVNEASSRWATSQTISNPYLYIPFKNSSRHLVVLPENFKMEGNIDPQDRQRSIYKLLFYKATLNGKGDFQFRFPKDIDTSALQLYDAKICMNISDFKGIEERIAVTFNNTVYELSPGVPTTEIDSFGLSAPVQLSETDFAKNIPFSFTWKIKGSTKLHFLPVSGNSSYHLSSAWASPSFDGNTLPNDNAVSDTGFNAKWIFNKANLPFTTILEDGKPLKNDLAFGVSILQPVDDYAKTARCVKYAVLFVGLTFSLFFIVEIMQKKPVHPVQYVLVGMALVIFYTLLLSISEYIHFDYAYLIASVATVLLISLYAKNHFKTWKIAGLFVTVLSSLYGFDYVLISLEDTALLVGSVGLFIVLAIVMYTSRKINWYNPSLHNVEPGAA